MVSSKAKTPKEYIDQLPEDRRQTMRKLRALVRKHLPKGYVEVMRWGMLCYEVPLRTYPDTYNKEPLMYAALASQKNHYGVYLCGLYSFDKIQSRFVKAWKKRGVKLNMGKSCIRCGQLIGVGPSWPGGTGGQDENHKIKFVLLNIG